MPNLKSLSLRIKSINSTSKITKAMKMVAASKLGKAERLMKGARPFVVGAQGSLLDILTPAPEDEKPATSLLVAISSDKGLCGGLNSKCAKEVRFTHMHASTVYLASFLSRLRP